MDSRFKTAATLLAAILLVGAASGALAGAAQYSSIEELEAAVFEFQKQGQFSEALAALLGFKGIGESDPGMRTDQRAELDLEIRTMQIAAGLQEADRVRLGEGYSWAERSSVHREDGELEDAIRAAQNAIDVLEVFFGRKCMDISTLLAIQADIFDLQGDYARSETLCREVVEIRTSILGLNHPKTATAALQLADMIALQARYDESRAWYEQAMLTMEKVFGAASWEVANCLTRRAQSAADAGNMAEAEPAVDRAVRIFAEMGDDGSSSVAFALNIKARVCMREGRTSEAEKYLLQALEINEKRQFRSRIAATLNSLGIVYRMQGRLADAESAYEKALAIQRAGYPAGHPEIAATLNNLAIIYVSQGRYAEAEPLYLESIGTKERVFGMGSAEVARVLANLGDLYQMQERFDDAAAASRRALAIADDSGDPFLKGVAINNLAEVFEARKDYAAAESLFSEAARSQAEALGPDHPEIGAVFNNLGRVYTDNGSYLAADSVLHRALRIREQSLGPTHPLVGRTLANIGRLYYLQGKFSEALPPALRAFDVMVADFNKNSVVMAESDALTYAHAVKKIADLCGAIAISMPTGSNEQTGRVADVLLASKGFVTDALCERRRSLLSATDSTVLLLQREFLDVASRRSRQFSSSPRQNAEDYKETAEALDRELRECEMRLASASREYRGQLDSRVVSHDRIASLLPARGVLVEYVKVACEESGGRIVPHYVALVVRDGKAPVLRELGKAETIDGLVSNFVSLSGPSGEGPVTRAHSRDFLKASADLHASLWQPVAGETNHAEVVVIAPDAALCSVSFACLRPDSGPYLVETTPVMYVAAGRDIIRYGHESKRGQGLLAIGDPDFESYPEEPITAIKTDQSDGAARVVLRHTGTSCADFMAARWQPLPGARSEVRAVERAWASASPEKSDLLVGQFASETAFKDRSVGRRVIHLATHAYYLDGPCTSSVNENPLLRSGIILAGANQRGTTVGEKAVDDGVLTAFEVAAMDLEGTEMVVLSGCETGLGSNEQREGVYGLRRAFLMAGADRVVASLWPVDDRTTAALMARFYRDGGEPIYQRLRRAQLDRMVELRKRGVPDHPRDWGAFLLIGKP